MRAYSGAALGVTEKVSRDSAVPGGQPSAKRHEGICSGAALVLDGMGVYALVLLWC